VSDSPILVLAPDPEKLKPAFAGKIDPAAVCYLADLYVVISTAAELSPAIVLMFRDTVFDGPEFRTLAHHGSVKWVHVSGSGYDHILPLERDDLLITLMQGPEIRLRVRVISARGAVPIGARAKTAQLKGRIFVRNLP